ncbi:uncharacterized protein Bfra_000882 [Botrytis fragariae]|uniref:Uncharacterized protein n=1 Tax=Botrytis fragariae TaxID=1964551 RepID=A0A8H6ENT2_9HELO|nr:uncharacterized protein Bfra_000882 [Botrytis fragariae]KAF5878715.1 hypothetical protein Bfra_000882 [Botrytis fragariae]
MPLFWSKGVGGRRFGANITADRHGVRKPVWLQNTFTTRLAISNEKRYLEFLWETTQGWNGRQILSLM